MLSPVSDIVIIVKNRNSQINVLKTVVTTFFRKYNQDDSCVLKIMLYIYVIIIFCFNKYMR